MKMTIITGTLAAVGLIAVVSFTGCKDKSASVVTAPATSQVGSQQPTNQQPTNLQPTNQQTGHVVTVPQKVDLKAQPGRNVVITDLRVQGADGSTPANVQLNTPLRIRSVKTNQPGQAPAQVEVGRTAGIRTPENENNARLLKSMKADKADDQKK